MTDAPRMTMEQASQYLPMRIETLRWRRKNGMAPLSYKVGGRVVYERAVLDAFLAEERSAAGLDETG